MSLYVRCTILFLFACPWLIAEDQSPDQMAVDAISHPDSLELSLWAGSDQIANPVAFTFDDEGRMYVCETFRQSKGVEDNRGHMNWLDDDLAAQTLEDRLAYFKKHLKEDVEKYTLEEDRITVLEDKDGDGQVDETWVFADGFNDILTGTGAGVLVHDDSVYYTCIPDLWKLQDKDNDGTADEKESLHYGYGVRVAFRGHDSHGLVIGPDGRLYFSIGDRGYNIRTKDGRHLKDPESGAVFRCELDGSGLEVYATGLRNPQELIFDDAGNLFTGDNNSDSGDKARWVHVVEGSETGWRMAFQYLPDRGPWNREKLWHPRHPGQAAYIVPPIRNFADGPSGLTYYPGTGFGEQYRGTFFLCDFRGDAAMSGIRSFKLQPSGASFEMSEPQKFLWNVLATDADFGPDGSLYTTDWIQGWEGVNRGRVVRVSHPEYANSKTVKFVTDFLKSDLKETKNWQLARRMGHPDRRVRMKAQLELAKREATNTLINQLKKPERDKFVHLHAVWGLGHIARNSDKPGRIKRIGKTLSEAATHDEPWVRAAAATTMGDLGDSSFLPALVAATSDKDSVVQARAATALGKIESSSSVDALLSMLMKNDDRDVVIRHAGVMGLVGSASAEQLASFSDHDARSVRLAAVLALRRLKSEKLTAFLQDDDPFVVLEAVRAIHDAPVYDAMPAVAQLIDGLNKDSDEAVVRRVLNANFRLGSDSAVRKVAKVVAEDTSNAMKLEAIDMLGTWAEPSNRDRVLGMWRPLEARSNEVAKSALKSLFDTGTIATLSPEVSVAAIEVASNLGLSGINQTIRQIIADPRVNPSQRANLLTSLAQLDDPKFPELINRSLQDDSPVVRSQARNLLYGLNAEQGIEQLKLGAAADTTIERQRAFAKLGEIDQASAREFLKGQAAELAAGKVAPDTQLDVVQACKDADLDDAVAPFLATLKAKPYGEKHLATVGGDVDRGEKIFKTNISLSCLRCHRVGEDGGRVGPNLAGIGKEKDANYLLESIVDPNKKITEGFGTLIVATEEGLQFQGVLEKDTGDLLHLIDADEKRYFIAKDEIIAQKAGKSAMPEDLANKINPFELRDLIAFLGSLKTPYVDTGGHEE